MPSLPIVKPIKQQRGTILITVMLLFAVGVYMAVEMTYRQRVDIQRTGTLLARAQAYEYVLGAEEIARFALAADLQGDQRTNKLKDAADEQWGMKLAQPVEGGSIEGQLVDLQARFNLNWLYTDNKGAQQYYKSMLVKLMGKLGIPKVASAKTAVDQIADFIDADSTPTYPDGREDQEFMLEATPRRSADRLLVDVSELLLIPGLTLKEVEILAPFVTALPPATALNLNTASPELLASINCLDTGSITNARPKGGYNKLSEALVWQKGAGCKNASSQTPLKFAVHSEFYELAATAIVNEKTIKTRSMLYRHHAQKDQVDVQVIYRKQVDTYSRL